MSKFVRMPVRLTAENGAKSIMSGEFFEVITMPCTYEVCSPDDCPICEGTGEVTIKIPISWITIKKIYARAVDCLGDKI